MEIIFVLSWVLPLCAIIFIIASLHQILRALGEITAHLTAIRERLESTQGP